MTGSATPLEIALPDSSGGGTAAGEGFVAFAGTLDGKDTVSILNPDDDSVIGVSQLPVTTYTPARNPHLMALADDALFIAGGAESVDVPARVVRVNPASAAVEMVTDLPIDNLQKPRAVISNGTRVFVVGWNQAFEIDTATGDITKTLQLSDYSVGDSALVGNELFVITHAGPGEEDPILTVLDADTGGLVKTIDITKPGYGGFASLRESGGKLFVNVSEGTLVIDPATKSRVGLIPGNGATALIGDTVYRYHEGVVDALDLMTGASLGQYSVPDAYYRLQPTADGRYVYAVSGSTSEPSVKLLAR